MRTACRTSATNSTACASAARRAWASAGPCSATSPTSTANTAGRTRSSWSRGEDKQLDFTFGVSYLLRPNTTLIAQYAYTDVDSNIPINSFTRNVGTVSLRFNF